MRPTHLIALLAATVLVLAAVPAAANASVTQELYAGNKVERTATRYWPRFDFVAACDQEGRGRFWCDVSGMNGNCYVQGHATVRVWRSTWYRHWRVRLRGMNRTCF